MANDPETTNITSEVSPEARAAAQAYDAAYKQSIQDVLEKNATIQFGPGPGSWGFIRWQVGDPGPEFGGTEAGSRNGVFLEELLEYLVTERLPFLNNVLPSRETSLVITNLEQALLWVKRRQENRQAEGVRGTMRSHGRPKDLVGFGWVPPEIPQVSLEAKPVDPLISAIKEGLAIEDGLNRPEEPEAPEEPAAPAGTEFFPEPEVPADDD